jgi:hypothetical protein
MSSRPSVPLLGYLESADVTCPNMPFPEIRYSPIRPKFAARSPVNGPVLFSFRKAIVGAAEGAGGFDLAHEPPVRAVGPPSPRNAKRTDTANRCQNAFHSRQPPVLACRVETAIVAAQLVK